MLGNSCQASLETAPPSRGAAKTHRRLASRLVQSQFEQQNFSLSLRSIGTERSRASPRSGLSPGEKLTTSEHLALWRWHR